MEHLKPKSIHIANPSQLAAEFLEHNHLIDLDVATIIYLAVQLQRPMLIEGPPGVGKTQLAKIFAEIYDSQLFRLQCYEGLDETKALYEWNYQKQLLYIQTVKNRQQNWEEVQTEIYSKSFLLPRPLLEAISTCQPATLLIDEIDKSDEEFEAFLLELLSEYTVSIPELGTITAVTRPVVFLTTNGTRELSDPLKRRCVHVYLEYPTEERELEIIKLKCPHVQEPMAREIVALIRSIRLQNLKKPPSTAEVIDWANALALLGAKHLAREHVLKTLCFISKNKNDTEYLKSKLNFWLDNTDRVGDTIAKAD